MAAINLKPKICGALGRKALQIPSLPKGKIVLALLLTHSS
jgi:hypothetical protein